MTAIDHHAAPHPVEDRHAVLMLMLMLMLLRTAEFSDDPEVLDDLARAEVAGNVLRRIAHNPATSGDTLEYLIELDQRWLTSPVTRVASLGAGPAPVPLRKLTVPMLADSLEQLVTDPGFSRHAADVGARLRQEDGTGTAVRVLEGIAAERASLDGRMPPLSGAASTH